jgi:hypothetical protein
MSGKLRTLVWKTGVLTITRHPLNKSTHVSWVLGRQDSDYEICSNEHHAFSQSTQTGRSPSPSNAAVQPVTADIPRSRKIRRWANSHIAGQSHHPSGPKASHALTFKLDHSSGAAQKGGEPTFAAGASEECLFRRSGHSNWR